VLNGLGAYGMRSGNEKGSRVVMSSTLRDVR